MQPDALQDRRESARHVAQLFARAGHDAQTVRDEGLRGCDDKMLAQHCVAESRVMVTLDMDFADIRAFPPTSSAGMIVLRVRNQSRKHILDILARAMPVLERESVAGRLWIVSEAGIRIRGA